MQTKRMNNITFQCTVENTFGKQYLSNTHIIILVVTNTILLLGNIFSNSLVICLLVITRQLSNYSNKFTMLLSSSDVATALIVQTLQISVLFLPLDPPCPVSLLTQFFSTALPRISGYTIGIIGLDRYVRVRYIMHFRKILTSKRAYILMSTVCVMSVINALLNTVGAVYDRRSLFRGVTACIDIPAITFVVALQIKSVIIMKSRVAGTENPEILHETSAKVITLSSRIMVLFVICCIPFQMISFIRILFLNQLQGASRSNIEFFLRFTFFGSYINSIGNALLFINTNVQAKEYMRNKLGYL